MTLVLGVALRKPPKLPQAFGKLSTMNVALVPAPASVRPEKSILPAVHVQVPAGIRTVSPGLAWAMAAVTAASAPLTALMTAA